MPKELKTSIRYFNRRRVTNLLCSTLSDSLVLVTAPTGYGKTISLQNFLSRRRDVEVVWITFEQNMQYDVLWETFALALFGESKEAAGLVSRKRIPRQNTELEQAAMLLRRNSARCHAIVLDRYESNTSRAFNSFLLSLAKFKIPGYTFFVVCRDYPEFLKTPFFYSDSCGAVTQDDLAFRAEEIRDLFQASRVAISDSDAERLWNLTRGWPAALLLILKNHGENREKIMRDCTRMVYRSFLEGLQTNDLALLAQLSVFDKFTLDQAAFITQNSKVRFLINHMLQTGILEFNGQQCRYSLPPLIRMTARKELETLISDVDGFWDRCANWSEIQGDAASAFDFYAKAHNFARVYEELNRSGSAELADCLSGEVQRAIQILNGLEMLKYPFAVLINLYRILLYEDPEEAERQLGQVCEMFHSQVKKRNMWEQALGDIAILQGFARVQELTAFQAFHELSSHSPKGVSSRLFSRLDGSLLGSPSILWRYARLGQDLHKTAGEIAGVFREVRFDPRRPLNALGELAHAETAYYTGDLAEAERLAYQALYQAKSYGQEQVLAAVFFLLSRIGMIRGDAGLDAYWKELDELHRQARTQHLAQCAALLAKQYISSCVGRPLSEENVPVPMTDAGIDRIIRGSIMLQEEKPVELETFSQKMLLESRGNLLEEIYGRIYFAAAKEQRDDPEAAVFILDEALDLAQADEICMPVVEHAPFIISVLQRSRHPFARQIETHEDWLGNVCGRVVRFRESKALTEKEKQIVTRYADGLGQQSIAQGLNISMTETRKTLRRVYRKTGTTDIRKIAESLL